MAKGQRSTVKLRARNVKRTDPNGDYVKVQQQRDAEIATRLAERKFQPTTSQLERLQDIKERKEAGQVISEEDEHFLATGGQVEAPQQDPMVEDEGQIAPANLGSLSKSASTKKTLKNKKGKKAPAKRTNKSSADPAAKRREKRLPTNYI